MAVGCHYGCDCCCVLLCALRVVSSVCVFLFVAVQGCLLSSVMMHCCSVAVDGCFSLIVVRCSIGVRLCLLIGACCYVLFVVCYVLSVRVFCVLMFCCNAFK